MLSTKSSINTIYTKYKNDIPMIRELIGNMGTFIFDDNGDLSLEIAAKDVGSDIQKATWDFNKRTGAIIFKNKEEISFNGGTITTSPDIILKFSISENETLECKIMGSLDFDLNRYFGEKKVSENTVHIEYCSETNNNETIVEIFTGQFSANVDNGTLTVNIETDDQESKIKNIYWIRKPEKNLGSVTFADGSVKEFEGGQMYVDKAYTEAPLILEFVNNDGSLIMGRLSAGIDDNFYDDVPGYLR